MVQIDHLVYATPNLATGVDRIESLLGVRAAPGGQHLGFGTRNALIALGEATYLEIIGPDPEQPAPERGRIFGIDALEEPRLVTWVARGDDLGRLVADARGRGVELGRIVSGGRRAPDGTLLTWRLTDPTLPRAGGVLPFFIDWGMTPHPARSSPRCCSLIELRAQHPECDSVRAMLIALDLDLPVDTGPAPALVATIETQRGIVELR